MSVVSKARQDIRERLAVMRERLTQVGKLAKSKRQAKGQDVLDLLVANDDDTKALAKMFDTLNRALAERHAPKGKDFINYPNEIDEKSGLWKKGVLKSG